MYMVTAHHHLFYTYVEKSFGLVMEFNRGIFWQGYLAASLDGNMISLWK